MTDSAARLQGLVGQFAPPHALAGIAVARGDGPPVLAIATAPGITADADSLFRAASISKVVVGRVTRLLAERAGIAAPYATDISDILGWRLRNPHHPDRPLTLGQVASHCAGLSDAGGYLIPPGVALRDWIAAAGAAAFLPEAPGTRFDYCNLGYLVLAAAAEALGRSRFDDLARDLVLSPLGITGGFNWSGVPEPDRAHRIATFRRDGGRLIPQIDAAVAPRGISAADGTQARRGRYRAGADIAALSPQGGLRLSLSGALRLAQSLADDAGRPPLWTPATGRMDSMGGVFHSYGMGLQYLPDPPFYPRPLVGHFANAYGFVGGIWHDRAAGGSFAYALNGLEIGDDADDFRAPELAILSAVAEVLA